MPVTEHGDSFSAHTFCHELGHATGYRDEYINKDYKPDPARNRTYPGYSQHFAAYTMTVNETSMMYHNAAPRLHHCWYSMHRINESAKSEPLSNMLGGKHFVARLDRGGFWDSRYTRHLTATTGNAYQKPRVLDAPMKHALQHQLLDSPRKTISLALHDVGRDESSIKYFHPNQDSPTAIEYQAVLLVRALIRVHFSGSGWTGLKQRQQVSDFQQAWHAWQQHYRLVGGAKDIRNIYVHFLVGFSDSAGSSDRNYRVNFRTGNHPGTGDRIPQSSDRLRVYWDVPGAELVKYMLNTNLNIGQRDALNPLRDWVNTELGESFRVECF